MADPVWVTDTSSLIAIKSLPHADRDKVFARLAVLVKAGRLFFPREVLNELKRDSTDKRNPDRPCLWALEVEAEACQHSPTLEEVRAVLTEETRNYLRKLSLNTARGILGIPSVPLLGLLRAEGIS
jgi:hypothetical protein